MADHRPDRSAFIGQVAARLRLPPAAALEVLEEIDGHIDDAMAALRGEGLTDAQAEREAIARLGDAGELAAGIRRARQTRRRLLVAAGYGVWAGIVGAVWGYLFVVAIGILAVVASVIVVSALAQVVDLGSTGGAPLPAILSVVYVAAAAGNAGRRITELIADRSERLVADVRWAVAMIGGGALAMVLVFLVRGALDAATVVGILTMPIALVVGALMTSQPTRPARVRIQLGGGLVLVAIVVATGALVASNLATRGPTFFVMDRDPGLDRVGVEAEGPARDGIISITSSTAHGYPPDAYEIVLEVAPSHSLTGWSDLRMEAWMAHGEPYLRLDPAATGPAATAPIRLVGAGMYEGSLAVEPAKESLTYQVFTTGVAPDGRRTILSGPGETLTSPPWVGTVWEWFTSD